MNKIEQMLQELCPKGVEYKKLGEVCAILDSKRKPVAKGKRTQGIYPYYGANGIQDYVDDYIFDGTFILLGEDGSVINTDKSPVLNWATGKIWVNNHAHILSAISSMANLRYLYFALQTKDVSGIVRGTPPKLNQENLRNIEIPVPPLPIQEEIVRILDHFTELTASLQAELQARQEQYEYYRNRLLSFDDDIPKMKLNDIVTFMNGKGHEKYIEDKGAYIVVNSKFISSNGKVIKYSNSQISPVYEGMILMVMSDLPNGKALARCFVVDADNKYTLNQRIGAFTIRDKKLITTPFLYYILNRNEQLLLYDNGVDQTNLRKGDILNIVIPIPPISEQQRIVAILDKFETLVNDLSQGLPAEIAAVQEQYEYYRNKLLTFNHIESN